MNFTARTLLAICFAAALAGNTPAGAPLADPLAGRPSWKPAEWTDLRAQVLEWLGRQQAAESPRNEVLQKWPEAGSGETPDLLTLLVETFALVDQDIRALVGALAAAQPGHFPDTACLRDESRPPLVRNNCRLYVGRWAAQHEFYDEASALVDDLSGAVDPAERFAIAASAWREAGELALVGAGHWLGTDKWLIRELRTTDDRYALVTWAEQPEPDIDDLIAACHALLDSHGGYLQSGFTRGTKPPRLIATTD